MLHRLVSELQQIRLSAVTTRTTNVVDDVSYAAHGPALDVADCMVEAGNLAKHEIARLRLTLSAEKSTVIATTDKLAHHIAGGMTGNPFQVARVHTSLGTSLTCRRTQLQQLRFRRAHRRRARLVRLRQARARVDPLLRAGPAAVALWGASA
eukprot:6462380-Amphidinium_carterae.1